ncbi:MAG: AAA family ATPase [Patescibacteria group bacterium]|jgi:DNA polymerase-3 subunit delta'
MHPAFSDIIGHDLQLEYLGKALERGNTAHAYIFAGPKGVGKMAVAERLAGALLGEGSIHGSTLTAGLRAHPDFYHVERPLEETEGGRKRDISINAVRELAQRMSLAAMYGTKVAIIEEADAMTTEAQNALLKTLEEPAGHAIIILVTDDIENILPTIRSRAVPLAFARVRTEALEAELEKRGTSHAMAREIGLRSLGRPGVALRLTDVEAFQALKEAEAKIRAFLAESKAKKIATAGKMGKDTGSDAREAWFEVLARELRLDLPTSANALSALLDSRSALGKNANTTLALEHIALSL